MSCMAFSCNVDGEDNVGTDSYFPCDGRWGLDTCIYHARKHFSNLINKPYGFRICVGSILNHRKITNIIKL